ncbi:MAG: hypothetical protein PUE33_04835 [bacterium]|nr:hypothetical protein [bacterium]
MRTTSPKELVQKAAGNNKNQTINELVKWAENGDTRDLENFARDAFKEQGRDFDKEFSEFMKNFK